MIKEAKTKGFNGIFLHLDVKKICIGSQKNL